MDLEKFRKRVQAAEDRLTPEPSKDCRHCSNIAVTKSTSGALVLSCLLERAGSQMGGPPDPRAEDGPTAQWIKHALFTPSDDLVNRPGADGGAIELLQRVKAANETCPIMERIEGWLPSAPDNALANLEPPAPILAYGALRVAIGLDKPSS